LFELKKIVLAAKFNYKHNKDNGLLNILLVSSE